MHDLALGVGGAAAGGCWRAFADTARLGLGGLVVSEPDGARAVLRARAPPLLPRGAGAACPALVRTSGPGHGRFGASWVRTRCRRARAARAASRRDLPGSLSTASARGAWRVGELVDLPARSATAGRGAGKRWRGGRAQRQQCYARQGSIGRSARALDAQGAALALAARGQP